MTFVTSNVTDSAFIHSTRAHRVAEQAASDLLLSEVIINLSYIHLRPYLTLCTEACCDQDNVAFLYTGSVAWHDRVTKGNGKNDG